MYKCALRHQNTDATGYREVDTERAHAHVCEK